MSGTFFSITWGALENLVWLPLLAAVACVLVYRLLWIIRVNKVLAKSSYAQQFLVQRSWSRSLLKALLLFIATGALFLALLRPLWHKKEETVTQEGRDLVIALDVSRSMLAADCKPNRLLCAKNKIKALLKKLSCERVGLVLFSGSSIVQCPLTADYAAFLLFLDQIDAETISSGSTALDKAVERARELFSTSGEHKNKLLIIFTDGEDFSSNLAAVKEEALRVGMHIFTVGVGTVEGAPIPLFDVRGQPIGHQTDKKGNVVISHLNEGILQGLAHDSGSIYIRLTPDDYDVNTLVAAVNTFDKERFEDKRLAMLEEQYHYFLLVSFGCLLVEWIL
jgi:Ca-activated chloride channel homolog